MSEGANVLHSRIKLSRISENVFELETWSSDQ